MSKLRSEKWFNRDDEVGLLHRVALESVGIELNDTKNVPIIGIANSASELNPCNLPLALLVSDIKEGIFGAGGIGVEFPTISLGEDLMKPSAMLYRNLLSIEIEEMIRANPLDGIVILANCDKSVPGALMGALSANIPTVLVTGGARAPAIYEGKTIGTGTDLWRLSEKRRAGNLTNDEWRDLERCLSCSMGACNTMGTASTMAILCEVMGMMVPLSSTIPTVDARRHAAAWSAGEAIVRCVEQDMRPRDILTKSAFSNAIKVLYAIGGSTNAIIHLCALAGRLGIDLTLEDIALFGKGVPLLADVEPSGSGLIQDFDKAGGVPVLLKELSDLLDLSAKTVVGSTIGEVIKAADSPRGAIRPRSFPLRSGESFAIVKGSLAPDGAVIKTAAASERLLKHSGPALVFQSYEDMLQKIDDPDLAVDKDTVLVLKGCGPVGVPGMPEWGMIPIPAKLLADGVDDILRISDSRMSGTSFGTVVLHVAPEAAIGGPLALVLDGDVIELDANAGTLNLRVSEAEIERRRLAWEKPSTPHLRGWPLLYQEHVMQAPQGCDMDFLRAPSSSHLTFVEPEIGRS